MRTLVVIAAVPCGFVAGLYSGFTYSVFFPDTIVPPGALPLPMAVLGAMIATAGVAVLVSPRSSHR